MREALVQHTRSILDEGGVEALNLRYLASRIGISQPALYRHFPSKAALLEEVCARGFDLLGARAGEEMQHATDAYDVLRRYARTYVRYSSENRGWFRVAFAREQVERASPPGPRSAEALAARNRFLVALGTIVPPDDPAFGHAFRALWALAHGLAGLVTERVFQLVNDDAARIAAADEAIDAMLDMLHAKWGAGKPIDRTPSNADLVRGL